MKARIVILSIVSLLLAVISFQFFKTQVPEIPFEAGLEIGDEKDRFARLNYEKQRLVDPVTGEIPNNILSREQAFAQTLPLASQSFKAEAWKQRGPYNIGGRTRALAFDINNSDIMLTGGVSGGVFRSEDGGKSWEKVTGSNQLHTVTHIIQDTRKGKNNDWYYCSGEVYGNSADYPGDGIFKSTDNGKTWKALQPENTPQEFRHLNYGWRLALDHTRTDSTILFLASYAAILRSNDGGLNWKIVMGGTQTNLYLAGTDIAISPSGVHYATLNSRTPNGAKGIWRSEDGLTWTNITPSIFPGTYGRIVLDIYEADESLIYFLAHTPQHGQLAVNHAGTAERNSLWKYRYKSGDGSGTGGYWLDLSDNIPALRQTDGYIWGDFMSQGGYNMVVRIHPTDSEFVAIGGTNVFVSTDGFKSPKKTNWVGGYAKTRDKLDAFVNGLVYPNHHPDNHEILFHPDNADKMLTANDGGIAITNDIKAEEVEWTSLNNGYFSTQVYTVAFNQNPSTDYAMSNIVLAGFQDNETQYINLSGKTNDDWSRIACCDGAYAGIFDEGNYTWVLTSKQKGSFYLYKFNKEGERVGVGRVDPKGGANYQFINQYTHDPNNIKRIYLPAGGFVWLNPDITDISLVNQDAAIEANWVRLRNQDWSGKFLISIDVSTNVEGIVYLGTSTGEVYKIIDAHDPDNYSISKLDLNKNLGGAGELSSISVDPHNSNNVLISFSNYARKSIYFTEDGGETWKDVSGNLEENEDGSGAGTAVQVVKIVRGVNGLVYLAGTNTGLYSTTGLPGTATIWNREASDEIGICSVRDIDYRAYDDLLFVGTHGCGSFSTNLGLIAGSKATVAQLDIELYPNPAHELLNVQLPSEMLGSDVSIYSIQGQLLKVLPNFRASQIDVSNLEAGEYLLFAQNVEKRFSHKFTVTK